MKQLEKIALVFFIISLFSSIQPVLAYNLFPSKNEVKIATWDGSSFTYYLPSGIKSQIEQIFADSLSISGTIDSVNISDPEPHNSSSIPYLVYFITNHGQQTVFAHRVIKRLNGTTNFWDFFVTTDLDQSMEQEATRVVKCKTIENCNGCERHRTGFLGLGGIADCPCTNNHSIYCDYESTSGGFPWGPVLGFLGAVIAAIIAAS